MKRKVIRQGNNTLTVTLPRNWCKKQNIKGGNELEVKELNDGLYLSLDSSKKNRLVDIDVSGLDHNSIRQKIRAVYKKGFTEINVSFSSQKVKELRTNKEFSTLDVINEEVNLLMGCQIIHQTKNSCKIQDFTSSSPEEFENALRRIFLLIIEYANDFYSLSVNLDKDSLAGMRDRHFKIGQFIHYCLRLIHKGVGKDLSNSIYLYYIVTTLDDIVDIIKYCSVELLTVKQRRLSDETLAILKKLSDQHRNFYEFFYKPENDKILPLATNRYALKKKISALDGKIPSSELKVVVMMEQILELYYHISEPRMAL